MKKVILILPIYNNLHFTVKALNSLEKKLSIIHSNFGTLIFDIIIIDDGSSDGSSEWVSENYPKVIILRGDGNLWWSGAVNLGVKYAIESLRADFVLLWNNDIHFEDNYFIKLSKIILAEDLTNSIIGSVVKDIDSNQIWSAGGSLNKWTGVKYMNRNCDYSNPRIECDWITGMGTLINTSIIKKHNLYWDAVNFPQYYGDSDYTIRAKNMGVKLIVRNDLLIFNDTKNSGVGFPDTFRELKIALTSVRSFLGIKYAHKFYLKHFHFPFFYIGFLKTYLGYIISFLRKKMKK